MSDTDADPGATAGLVERLKGTAKSVAGTLTGNDDLKREGELHHEKVAAAETAAELQAAAAREQAKADLVSREREIEIERQRVAAQAAADLREQDLERERDAEQQRVATESQRQLSTAEQQHAARQAELDRQEWSAATERADAQQRIAHLQADAARAEQTAAALDPTATEDS